MPVYSNSRIGSFENCPLQYRYRYIDRIKRDVQGIEALLGKTVHTVLETLYSDRDRARSAGAGEYTALFRDLWDQSQTGNVKIVRKEMSADDYRAIGERCVETYYNRNHPFAGDVLGCEVEFEIPLDAGDRYRVRGFIDRVDRVSPGVLEIHDYKTGALPRFNALKKDRQLSLYEIAVRERWKDTREVRQVWHYLAHDKRFEEQRDRDHLTKTRVETIRAIQNIEATTDFPARRSPLCSWCDYIDICPEWAVEREIDARAREREESAVPPPRGASIDPRSGQYLLFGTPDDR